MGDAVISEADRHDSLARMHAIVAAVAAMMAGMEPHVDVITLGVRDLGAARRFYVDGLDWPPTLDVPDEVVFIQIGHGLLLSLYGRDDLAAEAGDIYRGEQAAAISFGHIVASEAAVTQVLNRADAAGGTIVAPAERRSWGGVSGYFADPDGYRWEVAHNPGSRVASDGRVTIGAVSE